MIKAIETHYAGCRFRSRLEARWAVFFDALGIEWRYEDSGYECSARLTGEAKQEKINYLPDFWLPDLGVFAEVKGSLTGDECVRLLDVTASLSSDDAGGCGEGPNTVVLGPIPSAKHRRLPFELHMHKGDLHAGAWNPTQRLLRCVDVRHVIANDCSGHEGMFEQSTIPWAAPVPGDTHDAWRISAMHVGAYLLEGVPVSGLPRRVVNAYTKARSARFEHGERG